MNTKEITLIITFTALCIVLIPIRIPTLYWPGFNYYFWEIPIVAAFLLFGFKVAFPISVLNAVVKLVFFPGQAPLLGFIIGFMPTLTMLFGVYLAQKFIKTRVSDGKTISATRATILYTALGVAARAGIMPFIDYAQYHLLFPLFLGRDFSEAFILALMPGIVLFNILVPLYGVSIGFLLAKAVNKNLKMGTKLQDAVIPKYDEVNRSRNLLGI
jgi:riboflavin transporter FmnP